LDEQITSIQQSMRRLINTMDTLAKAEKNALEHAKFVSDATLEAAAAEEELDQVAEVVAKALAAKKEATKKWRNAVA
jgi:formate-dependent nitrite reductase cytochrome c552 subunit